MARRRGETCRVFTGRVAGGGVVQHGPDPCVVRGSVLLATRRAVQRAAVVVMGWLGQRRAGRGVLLLQGACARVRAVCVRARARVCMCVACRDSGRRKMRRRKWCVCLGEGHTRGLTYRNLLQPRASSGRLPQTETMRSFERHAGGANYVTFSPDSKLIVSCGSDGKIKQWQSRVEGQVKDFDGHTKTVWQVRYSPDGSRFASCSADKTVRVWNSGATHTHTPLRALRSPPPPTHGHYHYHPTLAPRCAARAYTHVSAPCGAAAAAASARACPSLRVHECAAPAQATPPHAAYRHGPCLRERRCRDGGLHVCAGGAHRRRNMP